MKTAETRGSDPLDAVVLLRRPEKALRYGLVRRMSDAWAGRRDGKVDILALHDAGTGSSSLDDEIAASRRWLARNEATFAERDHREFLEAQAAVAGARTHLSGLEASLQAAREEGRRLQEARVALPDQPPAEVLTRRGPAEGHATPAVLEMRRRGEHARVLAAADGALAQAQAKTTALVQEHARVTAALNEVFEAQVTRSQRLRSFHTRRAEVYLRGFRRVILRRHTAPASLRLPVPTIPVPEWTLHPCPWTTPTDQPAAALRLVS